MKYRVYESVNNDEKTFKEHKNFKTLEEAREYCFSHNKNNKKSTFIINYKLEDGRICEEYFGEWTN